MRKPPTRKGIVLAGGSGTRLHPLTLATSKQLLPVYNKPLIFYPLSTLIAAGVRDILIITTPTDGPAFRRLLGDGSALGVRIGYETQPRPAGIAQALVIGSDFLAGDPSVLILGDNLFHGGQLAERVPQGADEPGAIIFTYQVADPERYGVVAYDDRGNVADLVEKPSVPPSASAVTGIYCYDGDAASRAAALRPSGRGELEITDLNLSYLRDGLLRVEELGLGSAWLDTGTFTAMNEAADFVRVLETRTNRLVGSPEAAAYQSGFITADQLAELAQPLAGSGYGNALLRLIGREPLQG